MGYWIERDEEEAITQYVGLFGFISLFSSLANLFSGLSPSEAKKLKMLPAYVFRWGWKRYNIFIIHQDGIKKLLSMYEKIVAAAIRNKQQKTYNTVRLCSRHQVVVGKSINQSFLSTSENSVEDLIKLNYDECPELAIIEFEIDHDAIVFPMRMLGEVYPKPKEGEVLILPGMVMEIELVPNPKYNYVGKDQKPAVYYKAKVSGPDFSQWEKISKDKIEDLEKDVFNGEMLNKVQHFVQQLNTSDTLPDPPEGYDKWVLAYKDLLMCTVYRVWKNSCER